MAKTVDEQAADLLAELDGIIADSSAKAKRNRQVVFFIAIFTIISSFAATVLSAVGAAGAPVIAFIAAIPGALAVANSTLKFEDQSVWFYERVNRLKEIRTKLRYPGAQSPDVVALGVQLDTVRQEMHAKRSHSLRTANAPAYSNTSAAE